MKVQAILPMAYVKNIDETVRFYCASLGFEVSSRTESWVCLERDDVEFMISLPNAHEPFSKATFTGSFYFRVDTVDQLWNQLKDKANVVYPIETFAYGMREFAIHDNNGYVLQFGQPV